jgi:hypothetical protein
VIPILATAPSDERAERGFIVLRGFSGGPRRLSSAGRAALRRRIQRRHLPAASSPVPASAVWPRDRGRRPNGAGEPTRSRLNPGAMGRVPWMRRPLHST